MRGPRDLNLQVSGNCHEVIDSYRGCGGLCLDHGVVPWLCKSEIRVCTDTLYVFNPYSDSDLVIKSIVEWLIPEDLHWHQARLSFVNCRISTIAMI
jgi:hypothetical protein